MQVRAPFESNDGVNDYRRACGRNLPREYCD